MTALPHSTAVPPFGRDINVLLFLLFPFSESTMAAPAPFRTKGAGALSFLDIGFGVCYSGTAKILPVRMCIL